MDIETKNKKSTSKAFAPSASELVDVTTNTKTELVGQLQWVGMESMQIPLRLNWQPTPVLVPAKVDCYVSLDEATAKGIHMSRLYELTYRQFKQQTLNDTSFENLLNLIIESQKELSESAKLNLKFDYPVERKSLLSELQGFRAYPVELSFEKTKAEDLTVSVGLSVLYSSTCPCSAGLARQLQAEEFGRRFVDQQNLSFTEVKQWLESTDSMVATAHAQRSEAKVRLRLKSSFQVNDIEKWIDAIEAALMTPVQTAVKRADEQEFARLNAQNLMFCEDAARRLKTMFENKAAELESYTAKVQHFESLHPHDAVAEISGTN